MGQDKSGDQGAKPADAKPVDPRTARRRQDAIGRRLRQMYDDVVNENVPDDFMSILGEADAKRPKPPGDGPEPVPEPALDGAGAPGERAAPVERPVKSDH